MRQASLTRPRMAALLLLTIGLAACNGERGDITASIPDTVEARHPIQVTRGLAMIDVLPGGGPGGLTDRQVRDISSFAAGWTANARGPFTLEVPQGAGPVTDAQSVSAAGEIRKLVLASGVPAKSLVQTRYPSNGPDHLAPVRLSYSVLEARLPASCDMAVEDAGYSDPESSNRNRQHWNFGCAQQQNIAAMVADPEDFIRPRAEDPPSAARRRNIVQQYRGGAATIAAQTSTAAGTQD
jgi:pilus assembly protein CpaD